MILIVRYYYKNTLHLMILIVKYYYKKKTNLTSVMRIDKNSQLWIRRSSHC